MNIYVWIVGFYAAIFVFQMVSIPALLLKRNDLADVAWGPGFPIAGAIAIHYGTADGIASLDLRSSLIFILITMWALRLFWYVGRRNLTHTKEDARYANWRKEWGKTWWWRSWLQVFVLQGLILYIILSPLFLAVASPIQNLGMFAGIGVTLWMFGFLFESIGDEQLRQFKSKPENKGKLMTTGLWSWTRHPNYFGEVTQWWGIWLLVLELNNGWMAIVSPLVITLLILKVSGVPMLEKLMESRPGFAAYKKRTSIFIPLPPRR